MYFATYQSFDWESEFPTVMGDGGFHAKIVCSTSPLPTILFSPSIWVDSHHDQPKLQRDLPKG
jgi:hypothetical protein